MSWMITASLAVWYDDPVIAVWRAAEAPNAQGLRVMGRNC